MIIDREARRWPVTYARRRSLPLLAERRRFNTNDIVYGFLISFSFDLISFFLLFDIAYNSR